MKVLICDDERAALDEMKAMTEVLLDECVPNEHNTVYTAENIFKLIEYIDMEGKNIMADAIFMDINLTEGKSAEGIEAAIRVREYLRGVKIIFFTGSIEYSERIFMAEPFDLIIKPVRPERLRAVLKRLTISLEKERNRAIAIKAIKGVYRIALNEVNYVESNGRYIDIHMDNGIIRAINKLDNMAILLGRDFVKCHKSFLVNVNRIEKLDAGGITLLDGTDILVSRKYKQDVKKALLDCV